jgi:hypothetical protein
MHTDLVGSSLGKQSLGRLRRRWKGNVEMNFEDMGSDDQRWMEVAQDWDQWQVLVLVMLSL